MLSVEQLPFFADDFSGQKLEVLLDLFAGLGQQGVSFLDLLLHECAGGLQRGIFGVDFPAFLGEFVAFRAQPLDLLHHWRGIVPAAVPGEGRTTIAVVASG